MGGGKIVAFLGSLTILGLVASVVGNGPADLKLFDLHSLVKRTAGISNGPIELSQDGIQPCAPTRFEPDPCPATPSAPIQRGSSQNKAQTRHFKHKNHRSSRRLLRHERSTDQQSETRDILNLLETGEKSLQFDTSKSAILILGNTGAGKSTFTHYITGNSNLMSQEKGKNTDEFVIADVTGQKIGNSTITSFTVFPELVIDEKTKTAFYDCPGFSDTRDLAHDIAATYLTKRVLENVGRVKLIFLVNHSSLKFGENRQDFMMMVKHAVSMIKNIDKFNESIALIVTKVTNQYTKKGALVPDEKVVENIAQFLRDVRDEVKMKSLDNTNENHKIVQFIDIILEQKGERYEKIGIFRRPDEAGPLDGISILQDGKKSLEKILHKYTQYTKHDQNDFGYTISAESQNRVFAVVEDITQNIATGVEDISRKISQHFETHEEEDEIQLLYDEFTLAYDSLLPVKETKSLEGFVDIVTKKITILEIDGVSKEMLSNMANYDRYLEFLSQFNSQQNSKPFQWLQGLDKLLEYLDGSQKWYNFLVKLYSILSDYQVQINVIGDKFTNVTTQVSDQIIKYQEQIMLGSNESIIQTFENQVKKSLKLLLDQVNPIESKMELDKIKHVKLDANKVKKVELILDIIEAFPTMTQKDGRLEMTGRFVMISQIPKNLGDYKKIQIFALDKVFIDEDLDLTGKQVELSILAPVWEVMDRRRIVLDGVPGKGPRPEKVRDFGADGEEGKAGGPAGKFLGIGHTFVSGEDLSISLVGGKGGPGQIGGDGVRGRDGTEPYYDEVPAPRTSSALLWHNLGDKFHECSDDDANPLEWIGNDFYCTFYGSRCTNGGDGGKGGRGGPGGAAGWGLLVGVNGDPGVTVRKSSGANGEPGRGGEGGAPGRSGQAVTYKASYRFLKSVWKFEKKSSRDLYACFPGQDGRYGGAWSSEFDGIPRNFDGMTWDYTEPDVVEFQRPYETVYRFVSYVRENLSMSVRSSFMAEFLKKLEENDAVRNLSQLSLHSNELSSRQG